MNTSSDNSTTASTSTEDSVLASLPRLKRSHSEVIRQQWLEDYGTYISKLGAADLKTKVQFGEVDLKINDLKISDDECLVVIPKKAISSHKINDANKDTQYKVYRLPMLYPTLGEPCVDVRALFDSASLMTFDPGFMSTASCYSSITYIDGPKGLLLHRGYRIEELCENSDYIDLSFLLLYGELPGEKDRLEHEAQIKKHYMVHEKMIEFYKGFRYNAHPMGIMCTVIGALSSFYHEELDIHNADHRLLCAYRLIAKMPTLAAMAYKTSIGEPIIYPKTKLSFSENFLYMLFAVPSEEYHVDPIVARALEVFIMLHADHEQNASTSTVRISGSSHANPYACIACGITALWGPAHGGANEAVLDMLESIGTKEDIDKYIAKAKDPKDPFRLMGFGHRVYKNYDPRAKVMQSICHQLFEHLQIKDEPLLELAMELEKRALKDEYFIKRKLFPNVDFYSGIVLKAMEIPKSLYTVLFAVARTIGWISHWKEMIEDPKQRIGRPRQLYSGKTQRPYVDVKNRSDTSAITKGSK